MLYALTWFVVLSLLALWSVSAWAFHAIAGWTVANAGVLAGSSPSLQALRLPDWLAPWVSPELTQVFTSMLSSLTGAVQALLAWAPNLAGAMSVAVWVVWAIGGVLLIVLGLVISGTIAAVRGPRSDKPVRAAAM